MGRGVPPSRGSSPGGPRSVAAAPPCGSPRTARPTLARSRLLEKTGLTGFLQKACERWVLRSILSSAIPVPRRFCFAFALCGAKSHLWCATGRELLNCGRTHQWQVIAEPLTRGLRGAEGLAHTPLAVASAPLPLRLVGRAALRRGRPTLRLAGTARPTPARSRLVSTPALAHNFKKSHFPLETGGRMGYTFQHSLERNCEGEDRFDL